MLDQGKTHLTCFKCNKTKQNCVAKGQNFRFLIWVMNFIFVIIRTLKLEVKMLQIKKMLPWMLRKMRKTTKMLKTKVTLDLTLRWDGSHVHVSCILNLFARNTILSMLVFTWNKFVGWLVVFYVPSTARSFRDSTSIYCPLRRTWSLVFYTVPN